MYPKTTGKSVFILDTRAHENTRDQRIRQQQKTHICSKHVSGERTVRNFQCQGFTRFSYILYCILYICVCVRCKEYVYTLKTLV